MLDNIRIILVRAFHPGNIGSAARAMKNMGITSLYLVDPTQFPNPEANKLACNAVDLIDNVTIVDSVYEACKDCRVVIASTARVRNFDLPELNPQESAELLNHHAKEASVALLFGPERMGLGNDDIRYAHYRVMIPTSPLYPSLNLASAVQMLCYEIYKQQLSSVVTSDHHLRGQIPPTTEELDLLYQHLQKILIKSDFIMKKHPGKIMDKIRTFITRSEIRQQEVSILRGILSAIEKR
ncbi:MAG: RNA methyltransferase [Thiotrichaceae bacterium]|nr:RNA methyltransferase [Thiotrichaceae bacterium]